MPRRTAPAELPKDDSEPQDVWALSACFYPQVAGACRNFPLLDKADDSLLLSESENQTEKHNRGESFRVP